MSLQFSLILGPPELVAFSDGSSTAYCSALYLRWLILDGENQRWESFLLMAKARVTPLGGITIPRSEMNALLTSYKLVNVVLRALRVKPLRVHFLIDSGCVISAMRSAHGRLSPYLANRRGQIEEYVEVWSQNFPDVEVLAPRHISGEQNIADLGTRGLALPEHVGEGSEWQSGPSFLALPESSWPISDAVLEDVPEDEILPRFRQANVLRRIESSNEILDNLQGIF